MRPCHYLWLSLACLSQLLSACPCIPCLSLFVSVFACLLGYMMKCLSVSPPSPRVHICVCVCVRSLLRPCSALWSVAGGTPWAMCGRCRDAGQSPSAETSALTVSLFFLSPLCLACLTSCPVYPVALCSCECLCVPSTALLANRSSSFSRAQTPLSFCAVSALVCSCLIFSTNEHAPRYLSGNWMAT